MYWFLVVKYKEILMTIKINDKAPNKQFPATGDKSLNLADYKGKYIVVYFYPKDKTPGCTIEGKDFQKNYAAFKKLNAEILGVSRDSLKSHAGFKEKYCFDFDLISDVDDELCEHFGVLSVKSLFGKKFKGIQRSTFLFNDKGILVKEWRKVKVKNHVDDVLSTIKQLQQE